MTAAEFSSDGSRTSAAGRRKVRHRQPGGRRGLARPGGFGMLGPGVAVRDEALELVTKDFRRTTLTERHRPIVRALAEAMFSPDGDVPPERIDAFVDEVDAFISPASKTLRFGLVLMLLVIRWSPLLSLRLRRFEELPMDERIQHLERLERSRVRQLPIVIAAYKTVLTMLFYEDEREQHVLGYPGAERKRWQSGRRALPIAGGSP